jgi:hypothetical protein
VVPSSLVKNIGEALVGDCD